ncbi:MAG: phosphoglycerate mutase, partial [Nitrospirae bacterium]|nr:phosphoglycerate mutase [Nitrospirota bacterium]
MKYIILIGDGMADRPLKELGGRTCLQAARTPNMDKIASEGLAGKVRTIPHGFPPGSDVANLSIFGYNPLKYYSGRAPLEAASMGLKLGREDVAYRCNLVTLEFLNSKKKDLTVMDDYSAGHITTREAALLIKKISSKLGPGKFIFYPGISYRHLMV